MPIEVTCEECEQTFSARDELAGKRVKCRSCGAPVRVPDADEYEVTPARSARPARPPAKRKSGVPTILWILLGGGALLIVLCAGVGLFAFRKARNAADHALRDIDVPVTAAPAVTATPAGKPEVPPVPWSAKSDPASNAVEWPEQLGPAIAVEDHLPTIAFPTRASRFVMTNLGEHVRNTPTVWDLTTGVKTGSLKSGTGDGEGFVLSPNGQHLAVRAGAHRNNGVEIYSVATGNKLTPSEVTGTVSAVDFAGPNECVVWTKEKKLYIVDANSGKVLRSADTIEQDSGTADIAISPGGRYVALGSTNGRVHLHEVATGSLVGAMIFPSIFSSFGVGNIAFSSDGTQLASFVTEPGRTTLILCDMNTGKTEAAFSIPGDVSKFLDRTYSYRGPNLISLPNGRGWLLYGGFVLDEKAKQIVWEFPYHEGDILPTPRQVTPNAVFALGGLGESRRLKAYALPWEEIDKVIASGKPSDALFGTGTKVRLQIQLGGLVHGGAPQPTQALIENAVRARLAAQQIDITDDAAAPIVRVEYREQVGPVMESFGQNKSKIPSTAATATATLLSPDATRTLFKNELKIEPPTMVFNVQPTALGLRDKTLEAVKSRLESLPFPLFVPNDPNGITVPGSTAPH